MNESARREANGLSIDALKSTERGLVAQLPINWCMRRLAACIDQLESGAREQSDATRANGVPNLGGEHISVDGDLLLGNLRFVSREFFARQRRGVMRRGDILLVKDGATIGKVAHLNSMPFEYGSINEHVYILRPRSTCHSRFIYYYLRSPGAQDGIWQSVTGSAQPGLSASFTKSLYFPLPPLPEQRVIARYLDYMDRRFRRYITAKERLIELLEEQKRAVINQAVTRGLDPDVPLKPSEVEWLGDIPAHWEVRRLKFLATKFGSGITPRGGASVYQESGIPFIRSQNVHFDGMRMDGVARIDAVLHEKLSSSHVFAGDVLLNITGASIGRTCAVPYDFKIGNVNQHVCIVRPKNDVISSEYLAAFLSNSYIQREIRLELGGASREGLNLDSICSFRILVPPRIEQERLVDHVTKTMSNVARNSEHINRLIELIKEYRMRLIADVVTGKLDVRNTAANLRNGVDDDEMSDRSGYPDGHELAEVG